MNIKDFENFIEQKILERGLDYYKSGCIESLRYDSEEDEWIADVSGSDDYTVTAKLAESGDILESSCDCPYDWGIYCKHQAAVFYSLRKIWEEVLQTLVPSDGHIPQKPHSKKTTFEEMIQKAEKDDLVSFLLDYSKENKKFKNEFMLAFSDKFIDKSDILDYAKNVINLSVNKFASGKFIGYRETEEALEGAKKVLEMAKKKGADSLFISTGLCVLLIKELVKLSDRFDDMVSVHGIVSGAIVCLQDIFKFVEDDDDDLEKAFDLVMNYVYDSALFEINIEWLEDILRIFVPFCHLQYICEKIEQYLLIWQVASASDQYDYQHIQAIKHDIIFNKDGEDSARKFMEDNIESNSDFRKMAIDLAIEEKDYDKALKLCLDGEAKDTQYTGLTNQWKGLRYKIYESTGHTDEQKKLAYEFALNGNFEYYTKLKKLYSESSESTGEWQRILEKILAAVVGPRPKNIYVKILVHENMKPELLEYCRDRPASIVEYYAHLMPDYEREVNEIFERYLRWEASQSSERRQYKEVCDLIKIYATACGKPSADDIANEFKLSYAKRPAFVDELGKI